MKATWWVLFLMLVAGVLERPWQHNNKVTLDEPSVHSTDGGSGEPPPPKP